MKKALIVSAVLLMGSVLLFTGCQQTAVTSAKVYMQQSNWDKAIEQCNLAIQQVPKDADAYFVLGQAYGEKGLYREMNHAFNKAAEFAPVKYKTQVDEYKNKFFAQLFNSGVNLIKQNKYAEAAENYKTCIEIFPNKMDSYKNLGYIYAQQKNDSAAIEIYTKAIQADSTDMEVRSSLGILHYRNKQYDKAIGALKPVIQKAKPDSKSYMDALYYTAYSYDLLRQTDKAIETYSNALAVSPSNKDLLFNLGRLHIIKENYGKAAELFSEVLKTDPSDFDANFNTGVCLFQMKKYDESIPFLKKSIEIKPDNTSAWANLVVALDQSSIKNPANNLLIGKGLMQLEKTKDALPWLKKVVQAEPANLEAWERLLEACTQTNDTKGAKEAKLKIDGLKAGK
jgi:tetratricopeptide (TPR) repeat protein